MRNLARFLLLALLASFSLWGTAGCVGAAAPAPVLRVATSGDYAPFSERVGSGYRGFDIEVAERFASDTGRRIAWVPFRWPDLMDAMQQRRFDVAMSGVTVRPERSVRGRFTLPVAETGAVLLIRESAVAKQQDASLRVAVNAGGHLERVTRAHFEKAQIRAIPDNAEVRAALATGAVDAVVSDSLEAPHWLEGLVDVQAVGPFTRDRKAYWVTPDAPELAAELDAWLLGRERDGSLAELRRKWFPGQAAARLATPGPALLAACDERLALMPAVAETKRAMGAPIVDGERELQVIDAGRRAVERAAAASGQRPPPAQAIRAFYRAQIDAAVEVQRRVLAGPPPESAAAFDLVTELRPALLRIGQRMAWLLVQQAADPAQAASLEDRVARELERHQLPASHTEAIAAAISEIASSRPGE